MVSLVRLNRMVAGLSWSWRGLIVIMAVSGNLSDSWIGDSRHGRRSLCSKRGRWLTRCPSNLVAIEKLLLWRPRISPLLCRSEEHTSELQSLMRTSYAVFCLKKKTPSDKNKSIVMKQADTKSGKQQ